MQLRKQRFKNLLGNPPKVTHEPITKIISKQVDIKLGEFTQVLDTLLRKIKNRKGAWLNEIPPEEGHSTTYCPDIVMPYIIKTQ